MNIQWYKRFICYVFIAILFASGMQVDIDNSHSYFACESKVTTTNQQYRDKQTVISPDYCTNELLQPRNTHYIKNSSTKRLTIRRQRSFTPTLRLDTNKPKLFYLEELHSFGLCVSSSTQIVIIEYIHRQDGAK